MAHQSTFMLYVLVVCYLKGFASASNANDNSLICTAAACLAMAWTPSSSGAGELSSPTTISFGTTTFITITAEPPVVAATEGASVVSPPPARTEAQSFGATTLITVTASVQRVSVTTIVVPPQATVYTVKEETGHSVIMKCIDNNDVIVESGATSCDGPRSTLTTIVPSTKAQQTTQFDNNGAPFKA